MCRPGPGDGTLPLEDTSRYLPHSVPVDVVDVVVVSIHSAHLCYTAVTDKSSGRSSGNHQIGNKPC